MLDYEVIVLRNFLPGINPMLLALGAITCVTLPSIVQAQTPAPQRQEELRHLLRNDCGACHGLRLTGGLGPALRPESLRDKSVESLSLVILQGRPGTPMPGWAPFMTDSEAHWLAESLVRGVSNETGVPDEPGMPDEGGADDDEN